MDSLSMAIAIWKVRKKQTVFIMTFTKSLITPKRFELQLWGCSQCVQVDFLHKIDLFDLFQKAFYGQYKTIEWNFPPKKCWQKILPK